MNIIFIFATPRLAFLIGGAAATTALLCGWLAADDDDDVDRVVFFWPRVDEEDIECPSVVILYCWCWCAAVVGGGAMSPRWGWNRMAGWIAGL